MPLLATTITESLALVIRVFKDFRPELMQAYGKIDHTSKADGSPVTDLDVKIENALKLELAKAYPEIGFRGEETAATPSTVDATWIVDPIDGTSSFMHGLPYCTNMAGLVVDGETVASVIYQFPTDELYTAIKGQGAFKNGERIFVKNTPLDDTLVFSGSFVYRNLSQIFRPYNIRMYAPQGASGYEFTRLAGGNIQGVTKLRCQSMIHDDVPGVLLVTEAGGEIVSFEKEAYDYTTLNFIAGSPNFVEVVKEHYDEIKTILEEQ